jgi:putative membrane protein (TIGR04086 family)
MKKSTVILIWGGITGIASAIFYQILYATGQEDSQLRWLNILIIFLGLFIGTRQFRDKANEGYLTFGQGFKTGFFMVLIITLIGVIATIVDLQLHPDFVDKIVEKSKDSMINKGMSEDQIEMSLKYVKMWTTPAMIILFVIVGSLISGAILSLITAGISTKAKPIFDDAGGAPGNETTN